LIVSASTECFENLPLTTALERLIELEFSSVEIAVHEGGCQLKPSEVADDLERAVNQCRSLNRLDLIAYSVQIQVEPGEEHYRQFAACCRLAKATKVVTIVVPSAEIGTPFNEEVEHLRKLVGIAQTDGVRVSIKSQLGRQSQDPDTVCVLCDNVPGLGLTFDPSPYICGPYANRNHEKLMKYVHHVHLRDTSKKQFQVRVGQGEIEYGRFVSLLRKQKYNRALSINISEMPDVDHLGELRKLRLLLESLL